MIAPEKAQEGDAVVRVIRKGGTIAELLGNGRALIDWGDGTQTKVHLADLEYANPQPWEKVFGFYKEPIVRVHSAGESRKPPA